MRISISFLKKLKPRQSNKRLKFCDDFFQEGNYFMV